VFHRHQARTGHESDSGRPDHRYMMWVAILVLFLGIPQILAAQGPPLPPPSAPVGLTCEGAGNNVQNVALTWTNTEVYDQIAVRRDGVLLSNIVGTATSYLDPDSPVPSTAPSGPMRMPWTEYT
jgi:hypothetical protein